MFCSCNSNSPFWDWWFTVRYQRNSFQGRRRIVTLGFPKSPFIQPRSQQNCTLTLKPKPLFLKLLYTLQLAKHRRHWHIWNVDDGKDGIVWQGGIIRAPLHNKIFLIESPRDYGTQARKCHRSCSHSVSLSDPQHTHAAHRLSRAPGKGSPSAGAGAEICSRWQIQSVLSAGGGAQLWSFPLFGVWVIKFNNEGHQIWARTCTTYQRVSFFCLLCVGSDWFFSLWNQTDLQLQLVKYVLLLVPITKKNKWQWCQMFFSCTLWGGWLLVCHNL